MALAPGESDLARALVERGVLTPEAIERAVQALERLRARGQPGELRALLLAWRAVTPAQLESLAAPAPPQPVRIGPYELRGDLGRGATATVHEAWDPALGRLVALKVVPLAPGDDAKAKRARREARALAALVHPNIVAVHATGETRDSLWIALERVAGRSLSERREPFSPREAAVLLAKVARALQVAHEAQLVHRDVKPANILVDERGEPRLADFGLALDIAGKVSRITNDDALAGSPAYLAPELLGGADATPASDVWALGVTLHELLGGELPFAAATVMELFGKIASDPPRPLPRAAGELTRVVEKALEKDPRDRYASAAALAADLEAFARGEPVSARPRSPGARLARGLARRPGLAVLGVVALVSLAGAPFVVSRLRSRAAEEAARAAGRPYEEALDRGRAAEARGDPAAAFDGYERALVLRPDDPAALAGRGRSEADLGDVCAAERTLARARSLAGLPESDRGPTDAALARALLDRASILPGLESAATVERARELAQAARARAPGDALAAATLARALASARRPDEARAILERLRDPAPPVAAEAALALAVAAYLAPDDATAVREARLAAQGPPRARLVAAWLLVVAGEPEEGQALLESDALARETGTLHLVRAQVCAQDLRFEDAERERLVAAAHGAQDELLEARLARATGRDSVLDSVRAVVDRAADLLERGDPARALELARQAQRSREADRALVSDIEILLVSARALLATGDAARALECVDFAIEHAGRLRSLVRTRTQVLLALRRYADAEASAAEVLAHVPGDPASARDRVRALLLLGRGSDAEREAAAFARTRKAGDAAGAELEGLVAFDLGRYADAFAAARRAQGERPRSLAALLALAERLALAPVGDPPGDVAAAADWGEGPLALWTTESADASTEPVHISCERDRRRVVVGSDSTRLWFVRGGAGTATVVAPEGRPWDLGRRALGFWVHAEEREAVRAAKGVELAVVLQDSQEKKITLRPADSGLASGAWRRVRLELAGDPGTARTGDADFDPTRIAAIGFRVDGLPASGGFVWIDGIGPD